MRSKTKRDTTRTHTHTKALQMEGPVRTTRPFQQATHCTPAKETEQEGSCPGSPLQSCIPSMSTLPRAQHRTQDCQDSGGRVQGGKKRLFLRVSNSVSVCSASSLKCAAGTTDSSTTPNSEETRSTFSETEHTSTFQSKSLCHTEENLASLLSLTTLPGFLDGLGQLLMLPHTDPYREKN